jgi:hypothetical protein
MFLLILRIGNLIKQEIWLFLLSCQMVTEGFDTKDLQEAKALLAELS